jgi:hypothetical protein
MPKTTRHTSSSSSPVPRSLNAGTTYDPTPLPRPSPTSPNAPPPASPRRTIPRALTNRNADGGWSSR